MKVTLRQRAKGKKISLYLDYYSQGNRQYEYLELYLYPDPEKGKLTKEQKEHNRQILALAEAIRSKRHLEIQNGIYGFQDQTKLKGSFIRYIEILGEKRKSSKGNYGNWDSAIKHLKKFCSPSVTFAQINKSWLEKFKEYLQNEARTPAEKPLSQNSQLSYFNKIKAAIKEAYKDGIIKTNPSTEVEGIKEAESEREFLTLDELQAVVKKECEVPILKSAFIFSALTGLRWSDIEKLLWSEIQSSNENGNYIRFRQKKTKGAETLPISEQARKLLGEAGQPDEKVFQNLKYSAWHNQRLKEWIKSAKIKKT